MESVGRLSSTPPSTWTAPSWITGGNTPGMVRSEEPLHHAPFVVILTERLFSIDEFIAFQSAHRPGQLRDACSIICVLLFEPLANLSSQLGRSDEDDDSRAGLPERQPVSFGC